MATSVYTLHKGINRPIEFKGLKAQYIWYLGSGVIVLLLAFCLLYALGLSTFSCLGLVLPAGAWMMRRVYRLSNTYGEHGLMKELARRRVPRLVRQTGRAVFLGSGREEQRLSNQY
ncbi:DUF4133 domain-containing protein [Pontibacter actiniarum]|uniref:DUF4133 domain-containing protein n=1 Tax=Pontibacter actiniarum TaxID=323450 RepID=A0A1X9YSA0_9BACT|nr:DUF4133 domain-containing protein [Pontibacter actiniarum]ARS35742.1 hypothetical protein CA264_09975 [Pontibacter actiniarum]